MWNGADPPAPSFFRTRAPVRIRQEAQARGAGASAAARRAAAAACLCGQRLSSSLRLPAAVVWLAVSPAAAVSHGAAGALIPPAPAAPHSPTTQNELSNRLRLDEGTRTGAVFLADDDVLLRRGGGAGRAAGDGAGGQGGGAAQQAAARSARAALRQLGGPELFTPLPPPASPPRRRCSDVERAFAAWQGSRQALVGLFPRLVDAGPPPRVRCPALARLAVCWGASLPRLPALQRADRAAHPHAPEPLAMHASTSISPPTRPHLYLQYLGERAVFSTRRYNAMLTGAEFVSTRLLRAYWTDAYAAGRALVSRRMNCEDLLLNFVAAAAIRGDAGSGSGDAPAAAAAPGDAAEAEASAGGAAAAAAGAAAAAAASGLEAGARRLPPHVRWVQPSRRLDISPLSGVGLSRGTAGAHEGESFCSGCIGGWLGRGIMVRRQRLCAACCRGQTAPRCTAPTWPLLCPLLSLLQPHARSAWPSSPAGTARCRRPSASSGSWAAPRAGAC